MTPSRARSLAASALAAAAVAILLRPPAAAQAARPVASPVLAVSGRANANVSLASSGSFVAAVWSASAASGGTDIYAAVSLDAGARFAPPVRVNATAGDARVNGEQPPRISLSPRANAAPEIAVVWTTKGAAGTVLLSGISTDGGKTFRSSRVPGTDAPGNRGWEGLGIGPNGRFFTVWLDHRRLAQQVSSVATAHQHTPGMPMPSATQTDGVAMAQLSQLYVAALDGSTPPVAVTGGVCYCCKTAIASGTANQVYVAWRHVYPGNLRDIAFSASRDGGRTFNAPVRVSEDKWQLEGCPDDGPSMAVDGRGRIHIVWPTIVTEQGRPVKSLFHAVSQDGKTFSPRVRIPTEGQANHPQLAINGAGVLRVVWDESGSGTRHLASAIGRADASGGLVFSRDAAFAQMGTYPVVAPAAGAWIAAWTAGPSDASVIHTSRLGT